jgi:hypothetical protein
MALVGLFMAVAFNSCDDDENNKDNDPLVDAISAKWEISDSNSPYASFEFNKDGNYIVAERVETDAERVETTLQSSGASAGQPFIKSNSFRTAGTRLSEPEQNSSPVYFGTYRIEGNRIILSGFGSIEIISMTDDEFSFSLTLEGTKEKTDFVAEKSDEPIAASSRTDMLCRTWVLERMTEDGESIPAGGSMTVLFSRAGTYLVSYVYEGSTGLSSWKWANSQETQFYYSWEKWMDDWNNNLVTITNLTSTSFSADEGGTTLHFKLKK